MMGTERRAKKDGDGSRLSDSNITTDLYSKWIHQVCSENEDSNAAVAGEPSSNAGNQDGSPKMENDDSRESSPMDDASSLHSWNAQTVGRGTSVTFIKWLHLKHCEAKLAGASDDVTPSEDSVPNEGSGMCASTPEDISDTEMPSTQSRVENLPGESDFYTHASKETVLSSSSSFHAEDSQSVIDNLPGESDFYKNVAARSPSPRELKSKKKSLQEKAVEKAMSVVKTI
ncbi:hypothetical protein GUITHDRAFT_101479 [Guillardia theta CCMP2712]|uniref:Uncharacterized protein n=1 Tax=Guillardia theta (strain CCMP2712) TaxID=905079 RepID=L1JWS2_GUITC|nr:hypothetical protein GUITHDRAFT_101479 [Guillardia theta CCMP2712]EKX53036.1 hypothetical protein GUITHDRAFT_101479 [Guillardia theta CCMP2712]|eukprot:XP_005840016.1 hypothetical protein GUITHDRAFT_101479 [Guillardia theta CCMP2712]